MTKAQKKVSIDLNIRAIQIENLKEPLDVLILWKRGKLACFYHETLKVQKASTPRFNVSAQANRTQSSMRNSK